MEQTALDKPKPTSAMGNVRADMTKMAGTPWPWTILWRASNGTINSFNKIKELCCISHLRECFVYVLHIICYRSLLQFVHTCFSYSCREHEISFKGGLK
ncbi:hypothetical protein K7X08_021588 [Anisodus acutangulus]|uniref:Uncharacterized protein n=1 Tax=Anisodus acutangulus TaxID=402998 RepID=A0A9Q1RBE0_9SOLA|nr:hypothetical protein K7X08_021588 [Anisodus acutangulus]